jgi:putative transposase
MNDAYRALEPLVGTTAACAALGRSRASHYRRCAGPRLGPPAPRPTPKNALGQLERDAVLGLLHGRFVDAAPAQAWAIMLDEGTYLASESTMYRLLRATGESGERRRQATHPPRTIPELVADEPNRVWSYDVTKLKGPRRGVHYDLFVMLDIFSRYCPGWMIVDQEDAQVAKGWLAEVTASQHIAPHTLTIHADRGSSMTSKPVAALLSDLKVGRTHSRPHVSNDNPFSEAGFKTLKYCPAFPERFGSREDAVLFCEKFFTHYNHVHRHSGIGLHTPASVHYGSAKAIREKRGLVLDAAYAAHPERFFNKAPTPPKLPNVAWINKPRPEEDAPKNP